MPKSLDFDIFFSVLIAKQAEHKSFLFGQHNISKFSQKKISEQCLIRASRVKKLSKINKRACSLIRQARVILKNLHFAAAAKRHQYQTYFEKKSDADMRKKEQKYP